MTESATSRTAAMNAHTLKRGGRLLLLYHQSLRANAATIDEHIKAFSTYSEFEVVRINVSMGFPAGLGETKFDAVVMHYTLFGLQVYLPVKFRQWLHGHPEVARVCFFQDEYRYCGMRFEFLKEFDVGTIFTLLEPSEHQTVYGQHTKATRIVRTLTGYVSPDMVEQAERRRRHDRDRPIDVGYRARRLPTYMGKGSQEKHEIAAMFLEAVQGRGLILDISTAHADRLYGGDWYDFLGDCKAVLGVEAGTSIFDLTDEVREAYEELIGDRDEVAFEEFAPFLDEHEDRVFYRTVSPRHFEAAAFRCVQILYEGWYSGVLQPGLHFIELKKDYSNIDEVLQAFHDPDVRERIREDAYRDLIASGKYGYSGFVREVDEVLRDIGLQPQSLRLGRVERFRLWDRAPWRLCVGYSLLLKGWVAMNLPDSIVRIIRRVLGVRA